MKVKELIKQLKKCNSESEIKFESLESNTLTFEKKEHELENVYQRRDEVVIELDGGELI